MIELIVYKQGISKLTAIGVLNEFISYTYEKQVNAPGDFTLTLPYTEENYNLVKREDRRDKIIKFDEHYIGIVYKVTKQCQSNVKRIIVKGKHATNLYAHFLRQMMSTGVSVEVYQDNLEIDISHMTTTGHENQDEAGKVQSTSVPLELNHYVNLNKMTRAAIETCPTSDATYLTFIEECTTILGLGFDITLTSADTLQSFLIYPETKEGVVLSTEFGDLYDESYEKNSANYYSSCVAIMLNNAAAGPVAAFIHQDDITRAELDASQAKIYSMVIDGTNVSVPSNKAMNYVQGLAKGFLGNHKLVSVYDTNINLANSKYKIGTDYNLGDTISIHDKILDLSTTAQLTAYTKTVDSSGVKITPTFGFGQITLSTLLNRNGVTK